ncbi:MAG: MerR family transcriptional regulator [Bacillota bacterium]|nr:MerR family transcriptional regulator [Bacillota bacterium]
MRTYTLKEISKIINVPTSTIKQWEKDLNGLLTIPRSKQGARIFSETEIDLLQQIKDWEDNDLGKEKITEMLMQQQSLSDTGNDDITVQIPIFTIEDAVSEGTVSDDTDSEVSLELSHWNQEQFFMAMDQYKKTFLNEVKNEIRSAVRTEVVEEVKKEISKGNVYTVKSLSDSLYKASANVQDEMKELAFTLQKTADLTDKTFIRIDKSIAQQSIENSEEFYSISKQLAETSEELSHYIDVTNRELSTLTETLESQHEYFLEDREKFRNEVKQRELAFQGMLTSFREAAAEKEKKWWKFW